MTTGGGCFKCGSTDHIAKDCTADATMNQQPAKFVLKDNNAQRGGDDTRSVLLIACICFTLSFFVIMYVQISDNNFMV